MTPVGLPPAPVAKGRPLTDRGAVALAVIAVAGALAARPVPWVVGVAGVAVALLVRRPWLLLVGVALLASTSSARAEAGLRPARPSAFHGTVTLVTDPEAAVGGTRAVVKAGRRRFELRAGGGAAGQLGPALAGERLAVTGRVSPAPPGVGWLRIHHVVGRLEARHVEPVSGGTAMWRAANRARRLLERGAERLPPVPRSLFAGFVLGDRRGQPATVTDDFRAAGLTHLLAVSGENVAFVLALVGPAVRRCSLLGRWAATVAVIVFFGFVTRGEPSVLRASLMAGLAVSAATLGRRASTLRLLCLAVTALVLIDPLLVESAGFQLSVGASLGIVLLARPLAAALPGPPAVTDPLAVTVAAQLGVAPVLLATFGGLPVVSIPANLLVVPVAGVVMMWGLSAGLVAGVVGGPVAGVLHLPTRLMIGWIAGVARHAAGLPLGELHAPEVVLLAGGVAVAVAGHRYGRRAVVMAGAGLCLVALVSPAVTLATRSVPWRRQPLPGVTIWRAGSATAVEIARPVGAGRLLEALRRDGVRRLDLVITRSRGPMAAELVAALRHRWTVRSILQPPGGVVPHAWVARPGTVVSVGPIVVEVVDARHRLRVIVTRHVATSGGVERNGRVGS